jgi:hypothetical protein
MRGKRFTRHGKIPVSEDADNHNNMKQNISTYWKKSRAAKIRWEKQQASSIDKLQALCYRIIKEKDYE